MSLDAVEELADFFFEEHNTTQHTNMENCCVEVFESTGAYVVRINETQHNTTQHNRMELLSKYSVECF